MFPYLSRRVLLVTIYLIFIGRAGRKKYDEYGYEMDEYIYISEDVFTDLDLIWSPYLILFRAAG